MTQSNDDYLDLKSRRLPVARGLIMTAGYLCMMQIVPISPPLLIPGLLLLLCISVGWMLVSRRSSAVSESSSLVVMSGMLVVGAAGFHAALSSSLGNLSALLSSILVGASLLAVWGRSKRLRGIAMAIVLAVFFGCLVAFLAAADVQIDVKWFLIGGIDALLSGESPYAITIENPYRPAETRLFYGPGMVQDGRVLIGFPYLPSALFIDLPAHLLGEVRWMHLLAMGLTAILAWNLASDRLGRLAAVMLLCNPLAAMVVLGYWIEPLMALLLALIVWAMLRGHRWLAIPLGLLFASKQYAIAFAPSLVSVVRSRGWSTVVYAGVVGLIVLAPVAVMDLGAFWYSAVQVQFLQPFRDDAVSLLPGLKQLFGSLPHWLLVSAPAFGIATGAFVAWRTKPGATAFALGVGLALLVTVLFSKFGFMNYYYFIGSALLLASVTWPSDDPMLEPRQSSNA